MYFLWRIAYYFLRRIFLLEARHFFAVAHHFSIFALNFRTQFCGGSSLFYGGSSFSEFLAKFPNPILRRLVTFRIFSIFRTQFSAAPHAPHAPLLPAPPPATATFSHFSSSRKNYFFSRAPRLFSYLTLLSRYLCAEPPRRAATTPLSLSFVYVRYHLLFTIFLLPQSFYTLHIPTCAQKFTLHTHTLH